ncbi:PAS-domain containing protein [uncultured Maritimibacter sp.]|uniref:PAS-domain containing protein n=1 Tax=uncultured Maritimibacter sp. TaxID=991866 RepID=UPI002596581E|nr:PAS-domain containing protein [uncultured Maritimibacter sp.]
MTTLLAIALVFVAFLVAFAVLLFIGLFDRRPSGGIRQVSVGERGAITFVFENESLLDATTSARDLLASAPHRGTDWARLSILLEPRFPGLEAWIFELADLGAMERVSNDGTSLLRAEWHDGLARITLTSTGVDDTEIGPDKYAVAALNRELDTLRAATDRTPFPIWQEDASGVITWCNRAYLDLADSMEEGGQSYNWPPTRLFAGPTAEDSSDAESRRERMALTPTGEETRHWFEVETRLNGDGQICTAIPADDLVKAEVSRTEFVTTLSKTFASLPIGLAIFSRSRELAMFNPALLDLTTLPVDFLVSKPSLAAFLDRLREMQMMPEPKDYKSWRQRISDLVDAARNGTYEESWTLPGGQTYRVTGRPHPDGAVAFLFEDISAEIGLARRYRAEIETAQATLDALPSAIAVFSTSGVLTLSNSHYAGLWVTEDGADPSTMPIYEAVELWRDAALPSAVWDQIKGAVGHAGPRETVETGISLKDGRSLICRIVPLPRGFTLIEFAQVTAGESRDENDGFARFPMPSRSVVGVGN